MQLGRRCKGRQKKQVLLLNTIQVERKRETVIQNYSLWNTYITGKDALRAEFTIKNEFGKPTICNIQEKKLINFINKN